MIGLPNLNIMSTKIIMKYLFYSKDKTFKTFTSNNEEFYKKMFTNSAFKAYYYRQTN